RSRQGTALSPYVILSVLLSLLTLWCALGKEAWHIKQNYLEHRVGIRGWCYSRRYQDAALEIVLRYSANFNVSYFGLYAVMNGKRRFLMARDEAELQQLASFISDRTGWRILQAKIDPRV